MDRKFFAGAALVIVGFAVLTALATDSPTSFGEGQVAIIQLDGAITSSSGGGAFSSQGLTPETVRELNRRAMDRGADAIIYEWNSGGGAVVASKEIKREIDSVEVPTVCRFRDVAASGAYLGSLGCDRIVADSATLTGSIGVRSSYLEYSGLLNKLGIEYVNITAGELKDVGTPYRNTTERERELLQEKADIIHRDFVQDVVEGRNLSESERERIETGEIFLGTEAKDLGLVDTLGGRNTSIRVAENLTGMRLETFQIESRSGLSLFSLLNVESWFSGSSDSPIQAVWR